MGQAWVEKYPVARAMFAQADDLLDFPLSRLCFEGPESELNDTINTQVAIFVTSMVVLAVLREAGYQPANSYHYVAGHSLGEYSAYVAAGVLDFADGVRLVRERGRLMKQAGELNPGGMAAILKLSNEVVQDICQQVVAAGHGIVQVANYNAPDQIVISGHNAAVEQAIVLAQQAKARKIVKLPVSIATHSPLMEVIVAEFQQTIQNTPLNLPEIPIVANITAKQMTTLAEIQAEMAGQLIASVRWSDSIQYLISQGVTHFVEIGPKKVLTSLLKQIDKDVVGYSVQTPADMANLLEMRQD